MTNALQFSLFVQLAVAAFMGALVKTWPKAFAAVSGLFLAGLLQAFVVGANLALLDQVWTLCFWTLAVMLGHSIRRIAFY